MFGIFRFSHFSSEILRARNPCFSPSSRTTLPEPVTPPSTSPPEVLKRVSVWPETAWLRPSGHTQRTAAIPTRSPPRHASGSSRQRLPIRTPTQDLSGPVHRHVTKRHHLISPQRRHRVGLPVRIAKLNLIDALRPNVNDGPDLTPQEATGGNIVEHRNNREYFKFRDEIASFASMVHKYINKA